MVNDIRRTLMYIVPFFNIFFKKRWKKERQFIFSKLTNAVESIDGKIIEFDYFPEAFGNIRLIFKKGDKTYRYIVDRHEIYGPGLYFYKCEYPEEPYKKLIELIHELKD